jgi:hypothetical protein
MITLTQLLSQIKVDTDIITFSYLEIYNETVRDLVAPKKEPLMIIED